MYFIDVLQFIVYWTNILLLSRTVVNYFLLKTPLIYKIIGVSPSLFNCFEIKKFSRNKDDLSTNTTISCCICCEELINNDEVVKLKCHYLHIYHAKCIKNWLINKFFCPICKSYNII